ncbi:hypothetical protein BGC_62140 [Burkholderia sp. 3C]
MLLVATLHINYDEFRPQSAGESTSKRHYCGIFAYPPEVRRIIYTTNAIESMHMQLRKIVKNRDHFPCDETASKLLYLALRNIEKNWKMPPIT